MRAFSMQLNQSSLTKRRHSLSVIALLSVAALLLIGLILISAVGCTASTPPSPLSIDGIDRTGEADISFADQVKSNREDDGTVTDLTFTNPLGATVAINDFIGEKNLLLVFTRGFSGTICPFCTTQTSRLIANYEKFADRDTEVLLIYPGQAEQLGNFQQAAVEASGKTTVPFPILLDTGLVAVNRLGIAAHLAFPSTFLIDKTGNVRLSYVGSTPADRPSIKALLDQIDQLEP